MSDASPTNSDGSWQTPNEEISLSANAVHIWKVSLAPSERQLSTLRSLLSPDELDRVQRMKFQQHQHLFIAARSALRLILSRYLNIEAASIKFSQGPQGKPFILMPPHKTGLLFNLSHTQHYALIALTLDREIGIDLEYKHRKMSVQSLIERICSVQEKAIIAELEPSEQKQVLLACWTRKEAYVKATGKGISFPLHFITVSLPPTTPASLLKVETAPKEPQRWSMQEIQVDTNHVGALVVEGYNWDPVYWQWSWNSVHL